MKFLNGRLWLLSLFFYAGIGYCLSQSRGMYHADNILFFCVLAITYARYTRPQNSIETQSFSKVASWIVVLFTAGQAVHPLLFYAVKSPWLGGFKICLLISTLSVLVWAWSLNKPFGMKPWALGAGVLSLVLARVLVLIVSPHPFIDVFAKIRFACQHFLLRENPYTIVYPDIYAGHYGNFSGFPYLPVVLLWLTPFQWLTGDPRAGLLVADVLSALGLFYLSLRHTKNKQWAQIIALLWLSFPVSLFILEQSWIDSLLILEIIALALSLQADKFRSAGGFAGLLLATKQYSVFVVFFSAVYLGFKALKNRSALKPVYQFLGYAFVVSMLMVGPFLLLNPRRFLYDTVFSFGEIGLRTDSFSIPALLKNKLQILLPHYLPVTLYLLTLVILVNRLRQTPAFFTWARALVIMYTVTFLFGVQAFCNYYQLLAFLVLIGLTLGLKNPEIQNTAR